MRNLLTVGLLAAAALLPSRQSQAYEGPWCAVVNIGGSVVQEICSMETFEKCREEALRFGMTSFCRQNPAYSGYWSKPAESHRPKYRRRHHRS